ncbi:MAG: phosphoglycolate phosphatase [Hyphomicrobium sp.]|nr:phosphoglycolate phosphatase [Hyphomicrobium sp.]PPC82961.1 MAG: phosphoglycolate phosphatase [Hyphomicrobium sp.]
MNGLTLVFDLDGTLVDTAPDLVGATNHVLANLGAEPLPDTLLRPWISYGARRMVVEALGIRRLSQTDAEIDRQIERFLAYYTENISRESRPFPGTLRALDQLADLGATLAVCTNKRESLSRLLLDQLNMTSRFKAIAGRDTFPVCKPDPGHLTGAIALAAGDTRRAVMIGDSGIDIATAKAAGVPVVAVSFGYTERHVREFDPDMVIDHYDELVQAIARVRPGP